jgi:hypothetical protein
MANQMLDTTNYSQDNYLKKRQKEFGDYMDKLVLSNYGKADDYKAEAATLGMQTPQYFDYLTTSDPKNVLTSYATLSRDPLFDPKTYVARDPNEAQKLSPLNIYYQQELQNQIDAGIPESERIQMGQVMGMPGMVSAGGTMPSPYESYNDALARTKKLMGLRDGGRVNFNQGGWADGLTGEAKGIYDSMTAYGASDEEIQAKLQAQNLWSPDGMTTDTEQVTGIINQNIGGGGGDGDYQGGGKFGNLDLSDTKTFTKDVWSDTAGPPGQFGWTPTEVTGYMNPKTGQYQTFAGKNINHAGINFKPAIVGILEALGLGDKIDLDEYGGIKPGSIKGTFTDGFTNPFSGLFQQKATIDQINAMNKKSWEDLQAKLAAEKAAKEAARAAEMARYNITSDSDFGGGVPGGGGGNVTTTGGDVYGGEAFGYNEAAEKTDYYNKGGLATMFTRRR